MKIKYILIYLISFFSLPVLSQTAISVPYFCGFEDVAENANWVLNYGPQGPLCKDQWIINTDAQSEGRSGLYISSDGYSAKYGDNPNLVVAYREFSVSRRIPYDISFDWKSNGVAGTSDLYVLLIQPSDVIPLSNATSANIPATSVIRIYNATAMNNRTQWQNHSFQQTLQANTNYKLLFVWANSNTDTTLVNPIGACIDNVQIASTNCAKPYEFNVATSCDTTYLSWRGTSSYYEVEYKSRANLSWRRLGVQTGTQAYITNLDEGLYDFRVRGICTNDTSAYNTKNSVLIYCPERHCINYVDLTDASVVQAYYGTFINPNAASGVIDFGPENIQSRHTVNWTPDVFDVRTGSRLRTVPDGEFASVRLGNWATGAQAESLHYDYLVDSVASILLLRYAVVLENLKSHTPTVQPRFEMQILDEFDNLIDPTCGQANFYADRDRPGWNIYGTGDPVVTWKDWTTVGLNLSAYAGRRLKIKLTTYDCSAQGHYGYAYFTLNCASALIETNSCGDNPTVSISAPEGFDYTWYNPDYPDSIWTSRYINIPADDTTTYYVDVCYKEEASCCFTLNTTVVPRFPIADFDYAYSAVNCQNVLRFTNKSHVLTRSDGVDIHTTEPAESYLWDFENGQSSSITNPVFIGKNEGDTLNVTLSAYLANGQCSNDTTIQIIIPAIGQTIDTIYHQICEGESYQFGKYYIMQGGIYADTVASKRTGCDSITVLDLTVHPAYDIPAVVDTICYGESYLFAGRYYSATGTIERWLTSQYGCDSIVTLHLTVLDEITFDLVITDVLNGPNSGKIEIINTPANYSYSLNGIMNARLDSLSGGVYEVVLYNEYGCASETKEAVVIQDCLEIEFGEVPDVCADDGYFELNYTLGKGFPTTYDILFSEEAKSAGFEDLLAQSADGTPIRISLPDDVRPDNYEMEIVFEDRLCENIRNDFSFTIYYSPLIVEQKWNDVLAVLNERYNGGYYFTSFQWYKNGEPLVGETGSYLYLGEGNVFNPNDIYHVELTRMGEAYSLRTCPATLAVRSDFTVSPTLVNPGGTVVVKTKANTKVNIRLLDTMGLLRKSLSVSGEETNVIMPNAKGVYLLEVTTDTGERKMFHIMVK